MPPHRPVSPLAPERERGEFRITEAWLTSPVQAGHAGSLYRYTTISAVPSKSLETTSESAL
jgi:hypothetical protein